MNERTDLLPCPFCRGPVNRQMVGEVEGCFHIGDPYCPVESGRVMTIEQWNHRTPIRSDTDLVERVSVRIEPSTAQRLMDWGVLHFTDDGWVIDLDIWANNRAAIEAASGLVDGGGE